jgi:hypothetical protein
LHDGDVLDEFSPELLVKCLPSAPEVETNLHHIAHIAAKYDIDDVVACNSGMDHIAVKTCAAMPSPRVLRIGVACLVVGLAAVTTAFKWYRAIQPATVVYTKRTCTVLNTTVDVWGHNRDVCLPKVQVGIHGDAHEDFSGKTWAFKFLQRYSDSRFAKYEPDCAGWLKQFKIDAVVDCWQSISNPEIVKLDESNYSRPWFAFVDALLPTGFLGFLALGFYCFFCDEFGATRQPDDENSQPLSASETSSQV